MMGFFSCLKKNNMCDADFYHSYITYILMCFMQLYYFSLQQSSGFVSANQSLYFVNNILCVYERAIFVTVL